MYGKGFLTHLGKDRFEVSNVGVGRNFKKVQVKLLKKDMQDILKKYGRDNIGKKDEVIRKFVEFAKKVPKLWNPAQTAYPQPEFIPLEEAMPQIQKKPKIIPFIPLEEAVPQFQSKPKIKKKINLRPLESVDWLKYNDPNINFFYKKLEQQHRIVNNNFIEQYEKEIEDAEYKLKNTNLRPLEKTALYGMIKNNYNLIKEAESILKRDYQIDVDKLIELGGEKVSKPEPESAPAPVPKKPKKEIKPNFKSNNAFDILGVDENTSEKDIKTRYRELSRIYHPDKLGNADIQSLLNRAYKEIMDRQDVLSVAREKRAKEQEKFDLIDKKKLDEDFKKSLKIITNSKIKGKTNLIKQLKLFKTYRANKFTASVQIQMRKDYDAFRQELINNGLQEIVDLADTLFFMRDML